jgi:hypothetical protein
MLEGIRDVEVRRRQCLQEIRIRLDRLARLGEWMRARSVWEGE